VKLTDGLGTLEFGVCCENAWCGKAVNNKTTKITPRQKIPIGALLGKAFFLTALPLSVLIRFPPCAGGRSQSREHPTRPAARALHSHAPHLSQLQGRLHIQRVENILNRNFIGLVLQNQRSQPLVNSRQTARKRFPGRKFDCPTGQTVQTASGAQFHHAVAGVLPAAIDTQDFHVPCSLSRKWRVA
jgi:hypothetical protein